MTNLRDEELESVEGFGVVCSQGFHFRQNAGHANGLPAMTFLQKLQRTD